MNRIKQGFTIFFGVLCGLRIGNGKNTSLKAFVATLAIVFCGLVEAGTIKPWDAITENLNSSQVFHPEYIDNLSTRNITISEVKHGISKGISKFGMGFGKSILEVVSPNKVSTNTTKNESSDESLDSQLGIFLGFIFAVLIPMYQCRTGAKKPNDRVEGRGRTEPEK